MLEQVSHTPAGLDEVTPRPEAKPGEWLPPHVLDLWAREREVATIVYQRGPSTANEVRACLSAPLSSAAVRSMLMRLVNKGVLRLRPGRRGRGFPAIFIPTSIASDARVQALKKLSTEYFDNSMVRVALAALSVASERGELPDGKIGALMAPSASFGA